MAKKKVEETTNFNPTLKPEMYWEWRCTINEMDLAKKECDVNYLKFEMMNKDLEIARLRTMLFKTGLGVLQEKANLAKNEYEKMKAKIEAETGVSLNGCVIDDVTFEIKKLDQES